MTEHDRRYLIVRECAKLAKDHGVSTEYLMAMVIEKLEARMPRLRHVAEGVISDRPPPAISDDWIETGRRP